MSIDQLTALTRKTIASALAEFRRPAVLWSSGKDSMVLLHLLRAHGTWPVIFFREPFAPARYGFAQDIIRQWDLSVYEWPPLTSALCERNGHLSIIHRFQVGAAQTVDLPVDLVEPDDAAAPFACGLHDVLMRPKGGFACPWDLMFLGAKSSDSDALLGHMPLSADLVRNVGAPTFAFPLRQWTDADIWAYTEANAVPYQADRYEPWRAYAERADKTGNPDYVPGCTRCLQASQPAQVFCPKLKQWVNNVASQLPHLNNPLPGYIQQPQPQLST